MHIAVLKDILAEDRCAIGPRHQGHDLGLGVGWEAWIGLGINIDRLDWGGGVALNLHPVWANFDLDTGALQDVDQGRNRLGDHMGQGHFATGGSDTTCIRARLNPVWNHAPCCALELVYTLDAQRGCADAFNLGPHGNQAMGDIADLRFAGCILQHRLTLGQGSRQHSMLGCAYGDEGENNLRAFEAAKGCSLHIAAFNNDIGAHRLKGLQVKVDRAGPDGTATGQRNCGMANTRQERTQHIKGRAHLPHQIIRRDGAGQIFGMHGQTATALGPKARHAQLLQKLDHKARIGQFRHIGQNQGFARQKASGLQFKGRVLSAGDGDRAVQLCPADKGNTVHNASFLARESVSTAYDKVRAFFKAMGCIRQASTGQKHGLRQTGHRHLHVTGLLPKIFETVTNALRVRHVGLLSRNPMSDLFGTKGKIMSLKYLMFASVSLASLLAAPLASAQTAPATSEPAAEQEVETIVVYGAASSRQTQSVTAAAIALAAPGISPLKAIERLPGVNFQSADALGNYEWSTRISVRGFNQNQMGFTLDGVPLGDMSYGNHNGLHISRATISENIGRVELSQGAGTLGTASSSNLGGTLQFISRKPSDDFGGQVNLSGGSDSLQRIFARIETGTLDALGGGKGYVSVASTKQDKWKGVGEQNHDQVNVKYVQPVGAATVTAVYNWSDRAENDYQDLSLEMIRRLGYKWDNISGNYALANLLADIANNRGDTGAAVSNAAAGRNYPTPITLVDDAYFDASGLRKDNLAYVTLDMPVNEKVSLTA
ncbi:MAG: hypothetical protein RL145_432, partial [Pseudomonadota bacterium]